MNTWFGSFCETVMSNSRAALLAAQARADIAEAEAARAVAEAAAADALLLALRLENEKLRRELYGQRSERKARLLEQLELELEELEATASEAELAAERAAAKTTTVQAFTRARPSRKPFPEHLPRERVVVPGPTTCPCCGSERLCKLGETITETLESIPRQWKVIQTVREKFTCRDCEKISQPPAPFHVIPRGLFGPSLSTGTVVSSACSRSAARTWASSRSCSGFSTPTEPVRQFYRRWGFEDVPFDPRRSMIVRMIDLEKNGFVA
jgi:transposase